MKYLIELTKNWKNRNVLHLVFGALIAIVPNIILPKGLGIIITWALSIVIGHYWEVQQVKHFNATYSKKDVIITVLGGLIAGLILLFF